MPATNPRITVVVTPRVHAALTRFSAITGKSKSSMVGDLLDESVPMLVKMIKVIEAAKVAESQMPKNLVRPFEEAQLHIEGQLGLLMESVDVAAEDLLRNVEAIGRRKSGRKNVATESPVGSGGNKHPSGPSPLSNRGGRLSPTVTVNGRKSLTKKAKGKK